MSEKTTVVSARLPTQFFHDVLRSAVEAGESVTEYVRKAVTLSPGWAITRVAPISRYVAGIRAAHERDMEPTAKCDGCVSPGASGLERRAMRTLWLALGIPYRLARLAGGSLLCAVGRHRWLHARHLCFQGDSAIPRHYEVYDVCGRCRLINLPTWHTERWESPAFPTTSE